MKCTAAQAVTAFAYWLGYYEKASAEYASRRDKSCFEKNKGSNNYTYAGQLCGVQGQPWCAAQVSTAIYEACDSGTNDAKTVMRVWPYINCAQMWDAAPANMKGKRGAWTPKPGDVIVFTDDGYLRTHTGMVYAVDGSYVYTYEGNSGNMCRKRSYLLNSSYIYGYVRPNYAEGGEITVEPDQYGAEIIVSVKRHVLSKGCAGPEVKELQSKLNAGGAGLDVDGEFGPKTKAAVVEYQKKNGLTADGIVGEETWAVLLG